MMIIRPTASLAKRMKVKLQSNEAESTSCLGDWYAIDIVLDRKQFIMCVSSKPRLAVILEAAPYATFPDRLSDAVTELLKAIGVTDANIQNERIQMDQFVLAKTINKSILGTLNDYRHQLEAVVRYDRLNLNDTLKMSLYLSKTISLALPEGYPRDAVLKLFGQEPPRPERRDSVLPIEKLTEQQRPKLYLVK
jgi:hypothetical protein